MVYIGSLNASLGVTLRIFRNVRGQKFIKKMCVVSNDFFYNFKCGYISCKFREVFELSFIRKYVDN